MRHRFLHWSESEEDLERVPACWMGHAAENLNEEIGSDIGPVREFQSVDKELPSATGHLIKATLNLPPRAMRRPQPKKRRERVDTAENLTRGMKWPMISLES